MARGETFDTPIRRFQDARTGRDVWKLTCWDQFHCVGTYMYCQAFSGDERYVVFASNRSGRYELYRLDLQREQTVQMTEFPAAVPDDGADVLFWCQFAPDGRELLFREQKTLYGIDVHTLKQRTIVQPDPAQHDIHCSMPNLSADGKQLLLGCFLPDGRPGILAADVATGSYQLIHRVAQESNYISHILGGTCNGKPVISFVLDPDRQNNVALSRAERARSWKLDPATGIAEPFLVMPPGFRATHDYWAGPGKSRLYYHKKTVPTWTPTWIESIAGDGSDKRVHFTSDRKLGHSCLSPDGRSLVSDVQDPTGNELYLIDPTSGRGETLCWPDSTVSDGQLGHVHPSFSPSGRFVFYTSDHSGKAAVFVVPLHS